MGIIGGPRADWSIELFQRLLRLSSELPEKQPLCITLDSDLNQLAFNADAIVQSADHLRSVGADVLLIADTAGHQFASDISKATNLTIVDMVVEAVDFICDWHIHPQKIGVLDEDSGLDSNLYQNLIAARSIEPVCLEGKDQARFMKLGNQIIGNGLSPNVQAEMKALAESLIIRGSEVIISGCPWAAAALRSFNLAAMVIDSTEIVARRCLYHVSNI